MTVLLSPSSELLDTVTDSAPTTDVAVPEADAPGVVLVDTDTDPGPLDDDAVAVTVAAEDVTVGVGVGVGVGVVDTLASVAVVPTEGAVGVGVAVAVAAVAGASSVPRHWLRLASTSSLKSCFAAGINAAFQVPAALVWLAAAEHASTAWSCASAITAAIAWRWPPNESQPHLLNSPLTARAYPCTHCASRAARARAVRAEEAGTKHMVAMQKTSRKRQPAWAAQKLTLPTADAISARA